LVAGPKVLRESRTGTSRGAVDRLSADTERGGRDEMALTITDRFGARSEALAPYEVGGDGDDASATGRKPRAHAGSSRPRRGWELLARLRLPTRSIRHAGRYRTRQHGARRSHRLARGLGSRPLTRGSARGLCPGRSGPERPLAAHVASPSGARTPSSQATPNTRSGSAPHRRSHPPDDRRPSTRTNPEHNVPGRFATRPTVTYQGARDCTGGASNRGHGAAVRRLRCRRSRGWTACRAGRRRRPLALLTIRPSGGSREPLGCPRGRSGA